MSGQNVPGLLRNLIPISEIPLTWDSTGYTSEAFAREVARESFEGWDGDLSVEEEAFVIATLLQAKPGQTLLDVGCGYGRHDLVLAGKYGLQVTGVDLSSALIAKARESAAEAGLDCAYRAMHGRDLDWRDAFDHAMVAYNTFSVFSPEDTPIVLKKIHAALKSGGKLFLDLDNKPFYCRYGTCRRNWYLNGKGLVLQEVYFHEDRSVEVMRDLCLHETGDGFDTFVCFKRIYGLTDIRALLDACGFHAGAVYGNWDFTPLTEANPKIILTAIRP